VPVIGGWERTFFPGERRPNGRGSFHIARPLKRAVTRVGGGSSPGFWGGGGRAFETRWEESPRNRGLPGRGAGSRRSRQTRPFRPGDCAGPQLSWKKPVSGVPGKGGGGPAEGPGRGREGFLLAPGGRAQIRGGGRGNFSKGGMFSLKSGSPGGARNRSPARPGPFWWQAGAARGCAKRPGGSRGRVGRFGALVGTGSRDWKARGLQRKKNKKPRGGARKTVGGETDSQGACGGGGGGRGAPSPKGGKGGTAGGPNIESCSFSFPGPKRLTHCRG